MSCYKFYIFNEIDKSILMTVCHLFVKTLETNKCTKSVQSTGYHSNIRIKSGQYCYSQKRYAQKIIITENWRISKMDERQRHHIH